MSLPSGYKRLEYIQSTGTQYINTNVAPDNTTGYQIDFQLTEASANDLTLMGSLDPNICFIGGNSQFQYAFKSGTGTSGSFGSNDTLRHTWELNFQNSLVASLDGVQKSLTNVTIFNSKTAYIFATHYTNPVVYGLISAKVYSAKISVGSNIVRNFIPCMNADGEIGLYDLVGKQFYGNAGTGTFTAGPAIAISVALSDIRELEYIESSGTQYVNTGFKPNNNSRVVLDFEPTVAYSSIVGIFGTRDANSGTAANMFVFWNNGANTFRTDYFGTQKTMTVSTLLARQTVDKDKNVTTIGSVSVSNTVSTGQCSNNLYLFCTNNAGTAQYFAKLKLYSCQIYDNGTIIRDYIPAKLSDGTVGLYDKLNGLLYINAGTGTFISGGYISLKTGDILNYDYTGAVQSVTLPKGVYKLEVWGAQGGSYSSYYGGAGGYSVGTITFTADTLLYIYVGGQPATNSSNRVVVSGGFNGGGNGYNRYYSGTYTYGQGGGGGTDIRIGQDSLYARVIVAGGGGGSASVNALTTKYGGGTTGGAPTSSYAGTQTTGGSAGNKGTFGKGGSVTTSGNNYKYSSGGGGGGWYGGGAASSYTDSSSSYRGYNGGGSGFVWTGSNAPSGYLLGPEYYLTDASTIAGNASMPSISGGTETGHTGNGYARITAIKVGSLNLPVNIGGAWKDANEAFVNIGGTWKTVEAAFVNIDGTWKELG